VSYVFDIFLQVLCARMNSDISVAEDASLTTDAEDDSCIVQFFEIVPREISRKDFAVPEVKDEFPVDIKQESEYLNEGCGALDVNVSLCLCWSKKFGLPVQERRPRQNMSSLAVRGGTPAENIFSRAAQVND